MAENICFELKALIFYTWLEKMDSTFKILVKSKVKG